MGGVSFTGVTTFQQPGGGAFATNTVDPEGLRLDAPWAGWRGAGNLAAPSPPPQNRLPASPRKTVSAAVSARPRMALRWGKRPKRWMTQ